MAKDMSRTKPEMQERFAKCQAELERFRQENEMFRQLLDNARHGMWIEDTVSPKMLYVNPACEKIFGVARKQLLDDPKIWRDQIHPEDLDRIIRHSRDTFKNPDWQVIEDDYRVVHQDGATAWIHDVTVSIRDRSGKIVRSAGIVEDVTDRKKASDTLREWSRKIEVLHDIARNLAALETEGEVLKQTLEAADVILGLSRSFIGLTEAGNIFNSIASPDLDPSAKENLVQFEIRYQKDTIGINQTEIYRKTTHSSLRKVFKKGVTSVIRVPIGTHGIFYALSSSEKEFDRERVRMIELLLGHTQESLKRLRLQEVLKQQAIHDPLTGVYNRYYLNHLLRKEFSRSERYNHPIAFMMVDIDGFKSINDTLGHQVGDKVLQAVAETILANVRECDTVIRYGGDEFLIMLPETNGEVQAVQSRLSHIAINGTSIYELDRTQVTLSIGCAFWNPREPETFDDILSAADKRMYEAKNKKKSSESDHF